MIIKFHFKHEGGIHRGVVVPPNMILAYKNAISEKVNRIAQAFCFATLFVFLLVNNFTQWLPVCAGMFWAIVCSIGMVISIYFFINGLLWSGPRAVLLCVAMNTEGFEEYINIALEKMQKALSPEVKKVTLLPPRDAKQILQELTTAEILKQLLQESDQMDDVYDVINFLSDNYFQVKGFITKRIKDE